MSDSSQANESDTGRSEDAQQRSTEKDPSEWVTGGEPATGAQLSYLETLARQAGEEAPQSPEEITKADASREIDRLREEAGQE
ncbi:DUF3072 domain-containing protein [Motilibacter aurantiacus]|uniref:DUF3072 domain-containing protein n=1 Tax=Motilibacter aurantiacus TaxID=2714955 RepID=UPI0014093146|nr:DUF3072 domain-containing protein [Motilibacter aurantiacus]NHC46222.1 DUF3072 domain-containing protein [Motilibacter aurantiacus]